MIPTAASTSSNVSQTLSSAMMGIASVILEGRAVSDDDFILQDQLNNGINHFQRLKEKMGQLRQTSSNSSHGIFNSRQISLSSNNELNDNLDLSSKNEEMQNSMNRNQLTDKLFCEDKPLLSLQSLVTTTLCSTPRSVFDTRFWGNSKQQADIENMSPESMFMDNSYNIQNLKTKILTKTAPRQGPHCEQFLKKLGILKNLDSNIEYEEHICDTSVVNEIV